MGSNGHKVSGSDGERLSSDSKNNNNASNAEIAAEKKDKHNGIDACTIAADEVSPSIETSMVQQLSLETPKHRISSDGTPHETSRKKDSFEPVTNNEEGKSSRSSDVARPGHQLGETQSTSLQTLVQAENHEISDSSLIYTLRKHAAITTNLGGLVFYEGDLVTAMHLFQESVQTLMCLQASTSTTATTTIDDAAAVDAQRNTKTLPFLPSPHRQEQMEALMDSLSDLCTIHELLEQNVPNNDIILDPLKVEAKRKLMDQISQCFSINAENHINPQWGVQTNQDGHDSRLDGNKGSGTEGNGRSRKKTGSSYRYNRNPVIGFPGLFERHTSKLRVMDPETTALELPGLIFREPFRIVVPDRLTKESEYRHFIIPMEQCSKATLFNMGLIHYNWGRVNTALQFFDLASNLSQQLPPLHFDPVIYASFNNMAQIHLQYGRTVDARELLQDALTRGRAALAVISRNPDEKGPIRRLRRKLARTIMNLGHLHYLNCEFDESMKTCHEALQLLKPNTKYAEVGSVYHNIAVLLYHQGLKEKSNEYLNMFIEQANALHRQVDFIQLAEALSLQGTIVLEMGHLYDCMPPLNEALRIRQSKLYPKHYKIADSLCSIGRVLQSREEYDFCLNAFLRGINIYKSRGGLSFEMAQNLLDVGRALHAIHRLSEAIDIYVEATDITEKFFGTDHIFVARLHVICGNLHLEAGSVDLALSKFTKAARIHLQQGLPLELAIVNDPLCWVQLTHFPAGAMA